MKGSPEVIAELNVALKGELIAISQYFLHASLQQVGCENYCTQLIQPT